MRDCDLDRGFGRGPQVVGRSLAIGIVALGCVLPPLDAAMAQDQEQEREPETLILNRGRTFIGTIVDANRNTVAIRNQAGIAQIVRADDIQTVYIPPKSPDDQPFFGSFVDWEDGVYQLSVNFELVRVRDGVMIGEPEPIARPKPAPAAVAKASEPSAPTVAARSVEPAARSSSEPADDDQVDAAVARPAALSNGKTSLSIEADRTDEGASAITYRLTLSAPLEQAFYLAYSTLDGSAQAGEDYEAERDILIIPAGEQEAELRIPLIDDDQAEPDETLTLSVGASDRLVEIQRGSLETVIVDND